MLAGDDERRILDERLRTGLAPFLDRLDAVLASPALEGEHVRDAAVRQLEEARAELVQLVDGLVPPVLGGRGMAAALAELAARAPVPVELHVEAEDLPTRTAQTALFVTSEALANMAKHARSTHATVRLMRDDGHVSVEVTDDGRGGADPAGGSGLRGLIDRVEAMGGRLVIESGDGLGTRVEARLPLEEPRW
jgi:signal transduction histidine kinase